MNFLREVLYLSLVSMCFCIVVTLFYFENRRLKKENRFLRQILENMREEEERSISTTNKEEF